MATKAVISARLPIRRGLDASEAAIYLSLGTSFFLELVKSGTMPKPRVVGSRRIWDSEELDIAFRALPREGEQNQKVDTWADLPDRLSA